MVVVTIIIEFEFCVYFDTELNSFKVHDINYFLNAFSDIEHRNLFSKLASAQLSIIQHVIYNEIQQFNCATLNLCWAFVPLLYFLQAILNLLYLWRCFDRCLVLGLQSLTILYKRLKFIIQNWLVHNLCLNRVSRVAHLVRYSCIYEGKESLLSDSHFIENFLRDINELQNLMLTECCFNDFLVNLDVLESHILIAGIWLFYFANDFINIVLLVF